MMNSDVCIIYNPIAGKGRARQRLERLRRKLKGLAVFRPTAGRGHATELASQAAEQGFTTIGAAGGDGTVHEVANGLLRAHHCDATLAVLPIGSANDYAHSLELTLEGWLRGDTPVEPRQLDVGMANDFNGREGYFINNIGVGFNGFVSLEAEHVRGLQGVPLYSAALLRALWFRFCHPMMTITLDGISRQERTLAFSLGIGRREGGFLLAPRAEMDDGFFDYLHAGTVPRWELLRYVPHMITGRLPLEHPRFRQGRCRHMVLESETPLAVHMDGESFSRPKDKVYRIEVQILPQRLRVWCRQASKHTLDEPVR